MHAAPETHLDQTPGAEFNKCLESPVAFPHASETSLQVTAV
jgi:hypothetical protein